MSSTQKPTAENPKGLRKLVKRLNEYKTSVLEKRRRKKTLAALNRILDYAVDPFVCSDPDLDAVLANIHRLPSRSGPAEAQSDSSSSSLERILTAGTDCTGVYCARHPKRVNIITLDEEELDLDDGGEYDADDEDDLEDEDEIARERAGDQQSGYVLGASLPEFGEPEELLLKDLQEAVEGTASTCVPGAGTVGLTEEMSGMEAMERWIERLLEQQERVLHERDRARYRWSF